MGVGTIYRVTFIQELLQQQVQNVLHFRGNVPNAAPQHMAENWDAFVAASWKLGQSSRVKYKLIKVTHADGTDDSVYELIPTTAQGAVVGEAHPNQISALLAVRSNTSSRFKNGRIYIAGPPAIVVDPFGKLAADEITRYTTLATALMTTFGGSALLDNYTLGVYSAGNDGTNGKPVREPGFTAAETIRVNSYYATQRRRNIGVGA